MYHLENCTFEKPPNITNLFSELTHSQLALVTASVCVLGTIFVVFCIDTILSYRHRKQSSFQYFWHLTIIQGTYVSYSLISFISIISPLSSQLAELVFSVYIAFILREFMYFLLYLSNKRNESLNSDVKVSLALPPLACCCFCCCPHIVVSKKRFKLFMCGVYQAAVLRPILTFVQAVLWTNGYFTAATSVKILEFVNGASVLIAMYSLSLIYSATTSSSAHRIRIKLICIQVVMFIASIQQNVLNLLAHAQLIPCKDPFNSVVRASLLHHMLVIPEMLILLVCSCILQRRSDREVVSEEGSPLLVNDD